MHKISKNVQKKCTHSKKMCNFARLLFVRHSEFISESPEKKRLRVKPAMTHYKLFTINYKLIQK